MKIQSFCRRRMAAWTGGSDAIHPDTAEICIVLSGQQYLRIVGQTFVMGRGDVLVIPPQTAHRSWTEALGYEEVVIHVSPQPMALALYRPPIEAIDAVVRDPSAETVQDLLNAVGETVPKVADPQVNRVVRTVLTDLAEPWDVAAMARLAHWSPAHFSRKFSQIVGQPPMAWLRNHRVARAAWLLKTTDHSATRIAHQVGFSSPSRLSEAFAARFGTTPTAWRKG